MSKVATTSISFIPGDDNIPQKVKDIYPKIYDFVNLYYAYLKARKSKKYNDEVLEFTTQLESNLIQLQNELMYKVYEQGRYNQFFVYEPKQRLVMALPFRDRVVQWAIYRQLYPIFDNMFYEHSYACRKDKGTHSAADRLQYWLRAYDRSPGESYYLKGDVAKFFYRVNHDILIKIISRKIGCRETLELLWKIIKTDDGEFGIQLGDHFFEEKKINGIGMPIGNLTSQLFAGIYLDWLDKYIKHTLKVDYYIRYMDDFVILGKDKNELHRIREEIEIFLDDYLGLELNNKTALRPIGEGIDFCGYVIYPTHRKLRKSTKKKMKRRLKTLNNKYQEGEVEYDEVNNSLQSYLGILKHCDSYNLKNEVLDSLSIGDS